MDFLFEIGLEEVPARMLAEAQAELVKRTVAMLVRERLVGADAEAVGYSTPRRVALWVDGVRPGQLGIKMSTRGPSVAVAYRDGQPTPAAHAFARKHGLSVDQLDHESTPKGDYVSARWTEEGRSAAEVIAAELPKELAGIYWAKNMYWRAGKPERFVRPVRWMVALLGDAVVPVSFGGCEAGRTTYGHRVLFGAEGIEVGAPGEYVEALRRASVMVEVEGRRHTIRKALDRVCRTIPGGARWREDHALVDKMTHMTEWPSVILGGFEEEYLKLPEEVLVTVMRDHQNYFAVEDHDGKLAPYFLAVLNTVADEAGEAIIRHGNERVLRARFNDARFFWEFDQRVSLEERVPLLEKVTFQKDLGSYAAKSLRVAGLADQIGLQSSLQGVAVDLSALKTAARLFKADLTTELVKEFTELQGEIGGLYARTQGISPVACDAIYEHYRPLSMEDRIPKTVEGQILAVADKVDTIAGMFGLGLEPTGSRDPFALRRAANGVVKILAEGVIPLDLEGIALLPARGTANPALQNKIIGFFVERVDFYLREVLGFAFDVVKAVMSSGAGMAGPLEQVRDVIARASALTEVRGSEDFAAVSAAFKRMRNILAQADEKGLDTRGEFDSTLLSNGPEVDLVQKAADLKPRVAAMRTAVNYRGALELTATLRPQVDAFFEAVMVMDPDAAVRDNRLALLRLVLADFGGIADFSEIVVTG